MTRSSSQNHTFSPSVRPEVLFCSTTFRPSLRLFSPRRCHGPRTTRCTSPPRRIVDRCMTDVYRVLVMIMNLSYVDLDINAPYLCVTLPILPKLHLPSRTGQVVKRTKSKPTQLRFPIPTTGCTLYVEYPANFNQLAFAEQNLAGSQMNKIKANPTQAHNHQTHPVRTLSERCTGKELWDGMGGVSYPRRRFANAAPLVRQTSKSGKRAWPRWRPTARAIFSRPSPPHSQTHSRVPPAFPSSECRTQLKGEHEIV